MVFPSDSNFNFFNPFFILSQSLLVCMLSCFCHVRFFETLWTVAFQVSLFMRFSRQEYWGGLPCPPPGDFPDLDIEPISCISCTLGRFIYCRTTRKPHTPLYFPLYILPCVSSYNFSLQSGKTLKM